MKVIKFEEYSAHNSLAKSELVELMRSNGYLQWEAETFDHYYVNYPYESNSFLLVTNDNDIAGHLGFIQVNLSNKGVKSCWCLHALVDAKYRNLSNFIKLVKCSEEKLKLDSYQLIVAMPNSAAADIYQKCLKWDNIGYINFSLSHKIPKGVIANNRPLFFKKDDKYWKWRLNINSSPSLVTQVYRWKNLDVQQILYMSPYKLEEDINSQLTSNLPICTWTHDEYTNQRSWWSCRFMYKTIDNASTFGFNDINLWHLDMIDSDAFTAKEVTIL